MVLNGSQNICFPWYILRNVSMGIHEKIYDIQIGAEFQFKKPLRAVKWRVHSWLILYADKAFCNRVTTIFNHGNYTIVCFDTMKSEKGDTLKTPFFKCVYVRAWYHTGHNLLSEPITITHNDLKVLRIPFIFECPGRRFCVPEIFCEFLMTVTWSGSCGGF